MSEELESQGPSELESLKKRADLMGITYHPSIGVDKLREKINAALSSESDVPAVPEQHKNTEIVQEALGVPSGNLAASSTLPDLSAAVAQEQADAAAKAAEPVEETAAAKKNRLRREATKLIRIRVTCMNPNKQKWKGDMFCVSNRNFGTVQRYVPFNRDWHVEQVILDMIQEREYLVFDSEKTGTAGIEIKTPRQVPEFAVAILPPLTTAELKALAQRQAMADGTKEA